MVACSRYFFHFPPFTFLSDCSWKSPGLASYLLSFLISGLFLSIKPFNGFALQLVLSFCLSTSIVPFFRLERVESLALDWAVIHVFGKSAFHFLLQKQSAYFFTPEFAFLQPRCPLGSHPSQGSFLQWLVLHGDLGLLRSLDMIDRLCSFPISLHLWYPTSFYLKHWSSVSVSPWFPKELPLTLFP